MSIWILLLIVSGAGAVGGSLNALISDNGFLLPKTEHVENGTILRPGFFGNIFIGMIAAAVSWGLYGPLANYVIAATKPVSVQVMQEPAMGLTLASLVGAVLVGIGGARWLTNEVDKKLLTAAASAAAAANPEQNSADKIAFASPIDALNIAKKLNK